MKQSGDKNTFQHLHEAYISFKKKKYTNAVIILEQIKDGGQEDHYALFLKAVCLLYLGNLQGANILMDKIRIINPVYTPFIQLKAFLALKSSLSREDAIAEYISALEKKSSDRLLRRGLRRIEKSADFYRYQKEAKLTTLVSVPRPGRRSIVSVSDRPQRRIEAGRRRVRIPVVKPALVLPILLILLSVAGLTALFYNIEKINFFGSRDAVKLSREKVSKIDMVDISGSGYGIINRINKDKTPEFYSSGDILLNDFNEARLLMKKGYFNKAIIILNRITNSNASYPVKEKSDFLIRFIMESDERVYEEMDLKQFSEKPHLFRGSAVKFTGRTANVAEGKSGTAFTVMVGYDGNNFKGVCDVYDSAKSAVDNGDMVEVQGLFILNIGKGGIPYISAEKVKVISKNKG